MGTRAWYEGVPAPRDADGAEIPLDVDALYDKRGNRVAVSRWSYVRGRENRWTFNKLFEYPDVPHYPQDYHLSKPDRGVSCRVNGGEENG